MINKEYKALDKGYIKLLQIMNDDHAIASCARVSFQKEDFEKVDNDRDEKLIDYLIQHEHTSPFEMAEVQVEVKCPLFVARQWFRHRTGNFSEASGRYSEMKDDFYLPDISRIKGQDKINKQGSADQLDFAKQKEAVEIIDHINEQCNIGYQKLLDLGVSKEISRIVLPQSMYTRFVFKTDLHNLLHFISLRSHPHAQEEIQVYSNILKDIVKEYFPLTWKAFEKYKLGSI